MNRIPFDPYDFFGYLASGLLAVVGMELVLGFPQILGRELKVVDGAILLLGVYVVGQILATPSKALLEDFLVGGVLGRPSQNLLRSKAPLIGRIMFPGFFKPLPEAMRKKIRDRARGEDISESGEALFLYVRYLPETLSNEKLMAKLDSFLNKYGFTRNLSFTSLAVGVSLAWKAYESGDALLTKYAATAVVMGVLLFYRFLKFFRQYSYELFNHYGGKK
jgi:hypothetical protein